MQERLVILGSGESGVGAALLGKLKGYDVFVSDFGEIKANYKKVLINENILWEEKQHTESLILNAKWVVKSPGIPDSAIIIQKLNGLSIPVISEIEFASWFTESSIIAITGSNGKTTTTMLIYEMLKRGGLNVSVVGNVGKSFAWQVAKTPSEHYVLELSSFQLDGIIRFRPDVAILMNITPDHLDRYENSMRNYAESKFRITMNQNESDFFIYFNDDEIVSEGIRNHDIKSKMLPFSMVKHDFEGAYISDNQMKATFNSNSIEMSIYDFSLKGKHNACNNMAASLAGIIAGIKKNNIRECLQTFSGVEHRLEKFISIYGIEFINDSKATNINSTWYALESMNKPIVWIAGGVDKGNDYNEIMDLVSMKVKAIVCLGKNNEKIINAFENKVEHIVEADSMANAVKAAYYLAHKGDAVLLSPACASFDLFKNYEDRGIQFKKEVRNL